VEESGDAFLEVGGTFQTRPRLRTTTACSDNAAWEGLGGVEVILFLLRGPRLEMLASSNHKVKSLILPCLLRHALSLKPEASTFNIVVGSRIRLSHAIAVSVPC
jgi:hypothetical protein